MRNKSSEDVDYLNKRANRFVPVKVLAATDLVLRERVWDMVHVDIQGWESNVCRACIKAVTERVRWMIIGVHSRVQEAELLQVFHGAGWFLEHEKPTKFRFDPSRTAFESMATLDGTQVWRNPRLVAAPV